MAKLSEICTINMGQSPESTTYNENGEGLPFFQGNADFGKIHPNVRVWCNAPKKIAHKNDILISVRAPIGALNVADSDCCIGRGLASLSVNNSVSVAEYIWYALESKVDYLISMGTGSTFKAIGKNILFDLDIPLPPLETQRQIAANLDKVTHTIDLCNAILEKLDLLVKSRFVEMFGDPVENPLQWDTKSLDSACHSIVDCPHSTPSYTFEDTGYMCIRTSIVKKNAILWDKIEYIPKDEYEQRIKRRKPQKGDIIYTREGAILGIAAIIDRECNVALGQRSMLLSPDTEICLPEFISNAMNFDSFFNRVTEGVSGSASPHINVADIRAFKIMMPPLDLQEQFATFVEQTDKSKSAVKQVLEKAETLKKALMQEYFG